MADFELPTPGSKPWNLNPAIIAINNQVEDHEAQLGGLTLVKVTQEQYDALPTPLPADTLYIVTNPAE